MNFIQYHLPNLSAFSLSLFWFSVNTSGNHHRTQQNYLVNDGSVLSAEVDINLKLPADMEL
jgi:hypothetical protein